MSAFPLRVRPERPSGPDRGSAGPQRSTELALVDALPIRGGDRVLFLECDDGWVAEEAWRRMTKGYVCGVDRSTRLVARATQLRSVPGRLEFKTWDGHHLALPDGCFDRVVSRLVSEHDSEQVSALEEVRRVLRPGGELYLVDRDRDPTQGDAERAHAVAELRRLVERAGLVDVGELAPPGMGVGERRFIVRARRRPPV